LHCTLLVYWMGRFLCSILENGHFPDRESIIVGEMAGYWDYVGTLVEFQYSKSVNGFDELAPHFIARLVWKCDGARLWGVVQESKRFLMLGVCVVKNIYHPS
jgi:hypothetical protein